MPSLLAGMPCVRIKYRSSSSPRLRSPAGGPFSRYVSRFVMTAGGAGNELLGNRRGGGRGWCVAATARLLGCGPIIVFHGGGEVQWRVDETIRDSRRSGLTWCSYRVSGVEERGEEREVQTTTKIGCRVSLCNRVTASLPGKHLQ